YAYARHHRVRYDLPLHDALPIFRRNCSGAGSNVPAKQNVISVPRLRPAGANTCGLPGPTRLTPGAGGWPERQGLRVTVDRAPARSEEHTTEIQSRSDLVCRLLPE